MNQKNNTGMPNIDIQLAAQASNLPSEEQLRAWCSSALQAGNEEAELTLRIVGKQEIQSLNAQFRQKDAPTNVLSFPSNLPAELHLSLLGDVIICAEVVEQEAKDQGKTSESHWAHMVIHGTLHLQGYDHIDNNDAEKMEALETKLITTLGFPAPYQN